jgi:hypothetical protein
MEAGGSVSSYLIVIYGAPTASKAAAWELARSLPGKSASLSFDQLLQGAIAQPADDVLAELDMVHIQARLLVANYMRNGYNVVVEGPFYYHRGGELHRYEQDIDQLVALMRQMTRRALIVHLRGARGDQGFDYKQRYGSGAMAIDAAEMEAGEVTDVILEKLLAEDSS